MDTPNVCDRPDERIASEYGEYDALDPFTDEHDIEYWLWDGAHLIPASAEKSERLREREALLRLSYWQAFMEKHDHARPPLVSGAPVEEASGVIMPSPFEELPHNPLHEVQIVDRGGHLGFLGDDGAGGVRWAERRLVEWVMHLRG